MCVCIHTSTYYLHTYLLCEKEKIAKMQSLLMFMGEKGRVKQKILKKRMGVKWRDDVEGNETSMSVIFA